MSDFLGRWLDVRVANDARGESWTQRSLFDRDGEIRGWSSGGELRRNLLERVVVDGSGFARELTFAGPDPKKKKAPKVGLKAEIKTIEAHLKDYLNSSKTK